MVSYYDKTVYDKTVNPTLKPKEKKQLLLSQDGDKLIVIILSSFGVLLCVLLFSWLTLDPGILTHRYLHYQSLHTINTAGMTGKITIAELGNPLTGGIVTVSHKNTIVENTGMYHLPPIKPGTYTMKITHNNRIVHEQQIILYKGNNTIDFSIKTIVPGCMARHIPEGTPDTEMFLPITPAVYARGNPRLKRVAITIDDGWFEHHTLLDLFKSYNIRCTVFILGGRGIGNARPHWIKKMDDMGFEVCMHTYDHSIITTLSNEELEKNLRQAQKNITRETHKIYPYFRPPFGIYDKRTLDIAAKNGFKIIQWSVSIQDTYRGITVKKQVDHVLKHLQNGAIILAHFGAYNTLNVMKELIPQILEKGYEIVPISEVLEGLE